ncbi:MAG: 4Fe-4S binding protein [Bacteroidales bacterium]|nr:4Fe-4S binding protein [Bacteroidales bacterium]
MLRKIRIILGTIFFIGVTLLFLDFTGTIHLYLGWMAKVQFLPAVLAVNVIVFVVLILLTILLGRIYCSVICPLGVMQDIFGWLGKKSHRNRYRYSKAKNWLRYGVLGIFLIALLAGITSLSALVAPYSAYGRIAQNLFAPVYGWGNNVLAYFAERADSYAFYHKDVYIKAISTFIIAVVTFIIIAILAFRNGRTWCNTICPVGTILSFFARKSIFRPAIDESKCVKCTLCEKNCKASCINIKELEIDYSRCVVCGDCISKCNKGAISYTSKRYPVHHKQHPAIKEEVITRRTPADEQSKDNKVSNSTVDNTSENQDNKGGMERRSFIAAAGMLAATAAAKAQDKVTDGGLAAIVDKEELKRNTEIVPPGAVGIKHFTQHCTACQLCVSVCPNKVLRPSSDLMTLMQPRSSYERGYCRPECTKCSEVCPAGAIKKIDLAQKSSIQIGHAVWDGSLCLPMVDGTHCGNCARHCPTGAIELVEVDPTDENSPQFPVVNEDKCIGCGACEYVCPVRPISAIYVEGHEQHKMI